MALNKILSGFLSDFQKTHALDDLNESKLYESLVNHLIISKFHPDAFSDIADLQRIDVDAGSMFGIDAIAIIVNENLVLNPKDIETYAKSKTLDVKIIFIQTKTEEKYDAGSLLKTINAVKSFFGDRKLLEENENLKNAIEIFGELLDFKNSRYLNSHSPECYIYYVTAGKPCDSDTIFQLCESESAAMQKTIGEIKNFDIAVFGSDYIIDSYNEFENRIEVRLNFRNNLSLDKIGKVEQSYLGYISGDAYLRVITDKQNKLRRRLFYENVRDFLGEDNSVNKEISGTILTPELRDKFVLLNNGVTIVAKHFKSLGSNEYEMRDFQIVNGCQTSNEIYLNRQFAAEILIPIKIIHTLDLDLISMIVKATNRQTPVPKEAFIAMERFHKLLQDLFDSYSKDMPLQIHYERRAGEFQFLEKRLFHYQIVNLHSLIRAITSVYFKEPYIVYNNNPANILRNRAEKLFGDEHCLEIYYIANYLGAVFLSLQRKRILSNDDYKIKYYLIMVVRTILAQNRVISSFNSKEIGKESKQIIEQLKGNQNGVESAFLKARDIVDDAIRKYRANISARSLDSILRDPKFNDIVDSLSLT